jgi:hypothetical protein
VVTGCCALDEMLRADSVHHSHRPSSSSPPPAQDNGDELFADAYLFVAACSSSGFIRERALDAFARYRGPLAFATGLIRSTDWVEQVRTAAIALVRSVAPQLAPSDMVRFLELAVRLKDRVRVDENSGEHASNIGSPRVKAERRFGPPLAIGAIQVSCDAAPSNT